MSTSMTRGDDRDDRSNSPVPFERLNRAVTDLNVFNEQAQVIGAACAAIRDTPTLKAIRREFFGR